MDDPKTKTEDQDQGSKGGQAGMNQETDQTTRDQTATGFDNTDQVEEEENNLP